MTTPVKNQIELYELIFTMNWEDPEADHKALRIQPGDTVMTITSGACNTLGFLLFDPSHIHTVDINPSQSYLMELKIAAMGRLDYQEFVRFLGLTPASAEDRMKLFGLLRNSLSAQAAAFWDKRRKIIGQGLLFRGRYDHFVKLVGAYTRFTHGKKRIDRLLEARDLDEQRALFDRYWDIKRTRLMFHLFYNKQMLAKMGLKADYFQFDDGSNSFADSFFRKFRKVVTDVPVRGNYFLHAYFKGTYRSLAEVPAYLQEKNFAIIKDRLNRIHIHTGDAKKWLATMPENTFECLGLSNICELMSLADTQKMFDEVLRTAKPRARISFRNLVLPREVPENLRSNIPKDIALSKEIMDADRSFVYSKVAAYGVRK